MRPVKKFLSVILLGCMLIMTNYSKAQGVINYPVSITPVIYPPFPTSLKYINEANLPFMYVTITNKSSNAGVLNAQLGIKVKFGSTIAETKSPVDRLSVSLIGNTPVRLSNLDMAPLFSLVRLSIVTPQVYAQTFPQSTITYSFTLYDAVTQRQISEEASYSITFSMNTPPRTQSPGDKSVQTAQGAQNIQFQWDASAATGVIYVLQVVQLLYENQEPLIAFRTNPIYFTDSTFGTGYLYDITKTPPLLPNRKYAWRVLAKSSDNGGFTATVFANGGYSNVATFTYTSPCAPVVLIPEGGANKATISWLSIDNDPLRLQISYREKGASNWIDLKMPTVLGDNLTIQNLKPAVTYEVSALRTCVVASSASSAVTATSNIFSFATLDQKGNSVEVKSDKKSNTVTNAIKAQCGATPVYSKLDESNLLTTLVQNDVIKAGDFSITVVNATGGGGTFSGTGIVEMWLGGRVFKTDVTFRDVKINKDKNVIDGSVNLSNQ